MSDFNPQQKLVEVEKRFRDANQDFLNRWDWVSTFYVPLAALMWLLYIVYLLFSLYLYLQLLLPALQLPFEHWSYSIWHHYMLPVAILISLGAITNISDTFRSTDEKLSFPDRFTSGGGLIFDLVQIVSFVYTTSILSEVFSTGGLRFLPLTILLFFLIGHFANNKFIRTVPIHELALFSRISRDVGDGGKSND